jgi:hypothetical protein
MALDAGAHGLGWFAKFASPDRRESPLHAQSCQQPARPHPIKFGFLMTHDWRARLLKRNDGHRGCFRDHRHSDPFERM